jgi:hypothetical protein
MDPPPVAGGPSLLEMFAVPSLVLVIRVGMPTLLSETLDSAALKGWLAEGPNFLACF